MTAKDSQLISDDGEGCRIEGRLKAIWSEVLRRGDTPGADVGLNDNFLDLGGDSLAAMLCISRIRTAFGVEFSVEDFLLDNASISQFAASIEQILRERHHDARQLDNR